MEIKDLDELTEKLQDNKITVIDFYADWCGPCKMLSPVFQELSDTMTDVNFVKVNIDELNDIAAEFSVLSIPTLVFVKNQKEVNRTVGFKSKDEIIAIINNIK